MGQTLVADPIGLTRAAVSLSILKRRPNATSANLQCDTPASDRRLKIRVVFSEDVRDIVG